MISDFQRRVYSSPIIKAVRGSEDAGCAEVGVAADCDGGVVGCWGGWVGWVGGLGGGVCFGGLGGGGGGGGSGGDGGGWGWRRAQVAAYADEGRDDGPPAEEDVLRAVELGFAGYFVAGFSLDVVAAGGGAGFVWWH